VGPDIVLKEGAGRSAMRSRVVRRLSRCQMCFCVAAGFYYILTGGNTVHLYRTQDFVNWNESVPSPFISPSEEDAAVAPYSGFPSAASVKGSPPNQYVGVPENAPRRPYIPNWEGSNWTSWDVNVSACASRRFLCATPNAVVAVERWRHLLHARQRLVCIRDLGRVNTGRAPAPASDRL